MTRVNPDSIPLLAALPASVREQASVRRRFSADAVIFRQGEPTSGLWVILDGRTAVERLGPDGQIYTTGIWHPAEIIGIAGLWDGSPYPASSRALDTPTELLWIARERFLDLHRTVPPFGEAVSRALAERLRYVQESVADTRGRPLAFQVAVMLATLHHRFGSDIALTHEDVAHMLGTKRETVTRILADFHRRGWVEVSYGHIHVHDVSALEQYAEQGSL